MSKYIDADLLKSKLKDVATEFKTGNYYLDNTEQAVGYENALIDFEQIIDSFQHEHPKVDLERDAIQFCFDKGLNLTPYQAKMIASHLYELGLKARKEE